MDELVGFDWQSWYRFLQDHQALEIILLAAYASMLPQIIASVMYFAHIRRDDRNAELLLGAMISGVATGLVSGTFPAVGARVHFLNEKPDYLLDFMAIYRHTSSRFQLAHMQGIVTMPSYHTVLALLFVYTHRPPCRSFPYVATLNVLMLLSIPPYGGHYVVDVLAGSIIAAISIPMVHALLRVSQGRIRVDEVSSTRLVRRESL